MNAATLMTFDLSTFRDRAFRREALPDHPLRDTMDVQEMLEKLPADPAAALAELTLSASTMNVTDSFTPGRRARVLMGLDGPALPIWRELARQYLAPEGQPSERRDGDANILRALFEAASEFSTGFALVLDETGKDSSSGKDSRWVEAHRAKIAVRSMRWLGRRLALSHMLHAGSTDAIWEQVHRLHARAESQGYARAILTPFDGDKATSSVRQEYARLLIFELASPDSLRPRDVELAYRIAGRVAGAVRLEAELSDETPFAVRPSGASRPGPRAALQGKKNLLYIATLPALPRLRAMQERDAGRDPGSPDTLFGEEFTLRERAALLQRLVRQWGTDAPRRAARRVALASAARIVCGFEAIADLVPALDRAGPADAPQELRLTIDDPSLAKARTKIRAAQKISACRIVDASNGGLGLVMAKRDARWARHGALVAVMVESTSEWVIGTVRRIASAEDELRLGVQVLARQPRVLSVTPEALHVSAWEDAMRFEANFRERYRKTLLTQPQGLPLQPGELLVPAGLARAGLEIGVPLGPRSQRIRIVRVVEDGEHFQRVLFEPIG